MEWSLMDWLIEDDKQIRVQWNTTGTMKYRGKAERGVETDGVWTLQAFTYDSNNRITLRQTARDSWDNRASAEYA